MITETLSPILEINLYIGMGGGGNASHDMQNKLKFQRNSTNAKPRSRALGPRRAVHHLWLVGRTESK